MRRVNTLVMASSLVVALAPFAAIAAPAPAADAPASPADANSDNDIVVTALRRTSRLQDVPVSIAAISGKSLREAAATGLQDYFRAIPNLNLTQGGLGQSRISIRGVNTAGEATVGLYFGETPITGPNGTTQDAGNVAADLNLFDVERVEVLRGPQGTLYGSSSMGGTLRVIFNKPDLHDPHAAIEGQLSSVKGGSIGYFTKAMINEPIVDGVLGIRVAAYHEERPGYIDNVYLGRKDINNSTSNGVRALVTLVPHEDMNLTGTVIYQKTNAPDQQGWYEAIGRDKTNAFAQLPFNNKFQLYNLTYEWKTPVANLTATGSYYRYDIVRTTDFTQSYIALKNNAARCGLWAGISGSCSSTQLTQYNGFIDSILPVTGWQPAWLKSKNVEVRATSPGGGRFNWTIGGYYEDRRDHIDSNTSLANPATGSTYLPLRNRAYRYVESKLTQKAAFAEVSYKLVDGLTATYGARYYDYEKTVSGQNIQGDILFASFPGAFSSVTANAHGWLHKFNLAYEANRHLLFYATASKGFRPGGANNIPTLPSGLVNYSPDSLWNYEVGSKTTWLDGALTLNGALYQIDWSNMQTSARTADGIFSFITNAGKARIRGAELEMNLRPVRGLTVSSGLGYVDAKLTENQANSTTQLTGTTGRAGDRLPNVPKWNLNSSVSYSWPLIGEFNGLLRADWAYTGKMQSSFRPDTDPYFERYGNYHTVGLRTGIENEKYGAYLFVQNLTNNVGITGANSSFGIERQIYTIPPRTIGINGRVSF